MGVVRLGPPKGTATGGAVAHVVEQRVQVLLASKIPRSKRRTGRYYTDAELPLPERLGG